MASAAYNYTLSSAITKIFDADDDGGRCKKFFVAVRTSSTNPVLVRVPGLHKDGEFVGIVQGSGAEFEIAPLGIAEVYAKGDGGTAVIDFGVLSKE